MPPNIRRGLQHADLEQRQRDDTVTHFLERVSQLRRPASSDNSQAGKFAAKVGYCH